MELPNPTRQMFGYFSDSLELPANLRGQNIFYTSNKDLLYCTHSTTAIRAEDAEKMIKRGLIIKEEQKIESVAIHKRKKQNIRIIFLIIGCGILLLYLLNSWFFKIY